MSTFTLDTAGEVLIPEAGGGWNVVCWTDLTLFAQGYGEAMARALYETLIAQGRTHDSALSAVAFRNWAPETLAAILKDCEEFAVLLRGVKLTHEDGRRLWEARQARWPTAPFNLAMNFLKDFPPLTPTRADNGLIYFREAGQ